MKTLGNKVVAITGAASGMGRALALRCAGLGSKLALCDIDEAGVVETAVQVKGVRSDVEVDTLKVDTGSREQIHAWAERVKSTFGGTDMIVNNAGVSLSASVEKMRDEDFEWLFNINFWGVVNGCKAFLPQLRQRPEGHIVNLSSVFGLIGVPTQSAYCAAKFAVRGYSESLRQELAGSTVGITCVHPGGIKTEIVKRGRHYEDPTGATIDAARMVQEFERNARTTADDAAMVIIDGVLRGNPRVLIGRDAVAIDLMARSFPSSYVKMVRKVTMAMAARRRR